MEDIREEWEWVCAVCDVTAGLDEEMDMDDINGQVILVDRWGNKWTRCCGCGKQFHVRCLYVTENRLKKEAGAGCQCHFHDEL